MPQPGIPPASDLARTDTGEAVTLTRKRLSQREVIAGQLTHSKVGILLDGQLYIGYVRHYSKTQYRLLINDRILVVHREKVQLLAIKS